MRIVLPPSLRRDLHPIEEEVDEYRHMPLQEKLRILDALCKDAIAQVAMQPDPQRILDWVPALPASTVAALRRFRHHGPT